MVCEPVVLLRGAEGDVSRSTVHLLFACLAKLLRPLRTVVTRLLLVQPLRQNGWAFVREGE